MALDNLSIDEKKKVDNLIESGVKVLQEVADLKGSLKDSVKAVAEEIGVKPAELMKAINVDFKKTLADEEDKMETIRTILALTGRA